MGFNIDLNALGVIGNDDTNTSTSTSSKNDFINCIHDVAKTVTGGKTTQTTTNAPQPEETQSDKDFKAFQEMTEKTTGKKLQNLSDNEYKAAMKAFKASRAAKPAPTPASDSTAKVDQDSDAYKKLAEDAFSKQKINFLGTYESGYMSKEDYDKLTPEQQQNYVKDLKKAVSGE